MRVFETNYVTTRWPKKHFLLGIVFFSGDNPPIVKEFVSLGLARPDKNPKPSRLVPRSDINDFVIGYES